MFTLPWEWRHDDAETSAFNVNIHLFIIIIIIIITITVTVTVTVIIIIIIIIIIIQSFLEICISPKNLACKGANERQLYSQAKKNWV